MKVLYRLSVNKKEKVTEEKTVEVNGETLTKKEEVEKLVPIEFIIKKPNRALFDDAQLFHDITLSKGIQKGLMPRQLLLKRIENDGGVLADDARKEYKLRLSELSNKQVSLQELLLTKEDARTDEEKKRVDKLIEEIVSLRQDILRFEQLESSLYESTAEAYARNKTITWWVLNLAYRGDETPLFPGADFDAKITKYDELADLEDPVIQEAISRFMYLITFWATGRATTEEEFKEADKIYQSQFEA